MTDHCTIAPNRRNFRDAAAVVLAANRLPAVAQVISARTATQSGGLPVHRRHAAPVSII